MIFNKSKYIKKSEVKRIILDKFYKLDKQQNLLTNMDEKEKEHNIKHYEVVLYEILGGKTILQELLKEFEVR